MVAIHGVKIAETPSLNITYSAVYIDLAGDLLNNIYDTISVL